ncbi:hypothetical protein [Chromobacterium sp. IIBBL 290-4]|uniref:hypothetical protein n=1 Tax=Chromobacterium sp. IIBBL 290-4 TaxID=2953890 RepID=UPI0020B85F6C|nr:hypothetical protein [Chromobacterium sp. IIBBL 290-4]UTH73424.1 hypothetical protein NKT35_18060 [Chromobacterium sp. IIBBL 290-4]
MTESTQSNQADWSHLNLPVLTDVVDEAAVPTLSEDVPAETLEIPEFDFSSELDLLETELGDSAESGEASLEIPELTLEQLLPESAAAPAETSPLLDFANLPSLELEDASLEKDGGLDFVLSPKRQTSSAEADQGGLAALFARANPEQGAEAVEKSEAPIEPMPAALESVLAEPEAASDTVPEGAVELSWSDVVEAASRLPDSAEAPMAAGQEARMEVMPSAAESVPSSLEAAEPEAEPAAFQSISIDSLPSGVLGGGIGREPPARQPDNLEWLSSLTPAKPAEPESVAAPTRDQVLQEAERVLAEEKLALQTDDEIVAPPADQPEMQAAAPVAEPTLDLPIPEMGAEPFAATTPFEAEFAPELSIPEVAEEQSIAEPQLEAEPIEAAPTIDWEAVAESAPELTIPESAEEQAMAEPQLEAEPIEAAPAIDSETVAEPEPELLIPEVVEEQAMAEPQLEAEPIEATPAIDWEASAEPVPELVIPEVAEEQAIAEPQLEAEPIETAPAIDWEAAAEPEPELSIPELSGELAIAEPQLEAEPIEAAPAIDWETAAEPVPELTIPELAEEQAVAEPRPEAECIEAVPAIDWETAAEPVPELMIPELAEESAITEPQQESESIEAAPAIDREASAEPAPGLTMPELVEEQAVEEQPPVEASLGSEPAIGDEASLEPQASSAEAASSELAAAAGAGAVLVGAAALALADAGQNPADEDVPALSGLLDGRRGEAAKQASEPAAAPEPESESAEFVEPAPVAVVKVAAMSGGSAAKRAQPAYDQQALFNALYEQMLPRMKLELSLWLQEAIEVQAKQMLSGMMHQLKEDYEMLFGDALKESLRQALQAANEPSREDAKDE